MPKSKGSNIELLLYYRTQILENARILYQAHCQTHTMKLLTSYSAVTGRYSCHLIGSFDWCLHDQKPKVLLQNPAPKASLYEALEEVHRITAAGICEKLDAQDLYLQESVAARAEEGTEEKKEGEKEEGKRKGQEKENVKEKEKEKVKCRMCHQEVYDINQHIYSGSCKLNAGGENTGPFRSMGVRYAPMQCITCGMVFPDDQEKELTSHRRAHKAELGAGSRSAERANTNSSSVSSFRTSSLIKVSWGWLEEVVSVNPERLDGPQEKAKETISFSRVGCGHSDGSADFRMASSALPTGNTDGTKASETNEQERQRFSKTGCGYYTGGST